MSNYEEGLKLLNEYFGNEKDNLISVASIARENGETGNVRPIVRTVDAVYDNGAFYVVTYAKSNKVLQIEANPEVSICSSAQMFTANGKGKNLGWVLKPENAEIRGKLRKAFAAWYDMANNEQDENCCILAIYLEKGTLNYNHWEKLYHMDFVNGKEMPDGGIR